MAEECISRLTADLWADRILVQIRVDQSKRSSVTHRHPPALHARPVDVNFIVTDRDCSF